MRAPEQTRARSSVVSTTTATTTTDHREVAEKLEHRYPEQWTAAPDSRTYFWHRRSRRVRGTLTSGASVGRKEEKKGRKQKGWALLSCSSWCLFILSSLECSRVLTPWSLVIITHFGFARGACGKQVLQAFWYLWRRLPSLCALLPTFGTITLVVSRPAGTQTSSSYRVLSCQCRQGSG